VNSRPRHTPRATDTTRSLEFEEPFFLALASYFRLERLLSRRRRREIEDDSAWRSSAADDKTRTAMPPWTPHGEEHDTVTYVLQRLDWTLRDGWTVPDGDGEIMRGVGGVAFGEEQGGRGREWTWADAALGAIEWD
jgi:hypothetical protein